MITWLAGESSLVQIINIFTLMILNNGWSLSQNIQINVSNTREFKKEHYQKRRRYSLLSIQYSPIGIPVGGSMACYDCCENCKRELCQTRLHLRTASLILTLTTEWWWDYRENQKFNLSLALVNAPPAHSCRVVCDKFDHKFHQLHKCSLYQTQSNTLHSLPQDRVLCYWNYYVPPHKL